MNREERNVNQTEELMEELSDDEKRGTKLVICLSDSLPQSLPTYLPTYLSYPYKDNKSTVRQWVILKTQ
jgi:hypothetical protein